MIFLINRLLKLFVLFACIVASCAFPRVSARSGVEKEGQLFPEEGALTSRSAFTARKLAQDSWIDPFQKRLPGRGGPKGLLNGWFGSKQDSEPVQVQLAVEEGRKRMEVVSAAMAKRAKALGESPPREEKVSKAAAQLALKLARGGEEGETRGGRFADRTGQESDRKKKGGKLSPLDLAKHKMKKDKEDMYVDEPLEGGVNGGESDFLIIEDPSWEEGIVNEFIRQYVKELRGDYEGLDDTMHFQIDRVESQIREYARAQADAVWKAWEEVVAEEMRKSGLESGNMSEEGGTGLLSGKRTAGDEATTQHLLSRMM